MSTRKFRRWLIRLVVAVVVLVPPIGVFTWYQFFRDVAQPAWITDDPTMNFLYGSIGSESEAGIPYWIMVVLPRIFGEEYLPGPGGYASLGLPWEEGQEFPAGFSKKTVGFERVGFNCALCHATRYRTSPQAKPVIVAGGGSHTADIQGLLEFFGDSASDPRFNADTILTEMDLATRLSWLDRLLYKYLFIPLTRKQLIEQAVDFHWADDRPRWGPGRDAPMNLTKFNFLEMAMDDSVDNTDFPAIWNLAVRVQPGRVWPEDNYAVTADFSTIPTPPDELMLMNLAGDTTSFRSVLIDSALGLQAQNSPFFRQRMADLEEWLMNLPPPDYPLPVNAALAVSGAPVFEDHCANCHAEGRNNRLGTIIALDEIKTDAYRAQAWPRAAADLANEKVLEFGIKRTPMSKPDKPGYTAVHLGGIWLRAPYLHNGSVATIRDLLEPPGCRAAGFYRGYDVLDEQNLGFISRSCASTVQANACGNVDPQTTCVPTGEGWYLDTSERGNGNMGHEFGTDLPAEEKLALIEYLKTI